MGGCPYLRAMPLPFADRYRRALAFAARYDPALARKIAGRTFWEEFLTIFDPDLGQRAQFGVVVHKPNGAERTLSAVVPGQLLVEHRQPGALLNRATTDHRHYFPDLAPAALPRYVLVSDYARFQLYDLRRGRQYIFTLAELPENLGFFGFLAAPASLYAGSYHPANTDVRALVAELWAALAATGHARHSLRVLLLRLVCAWYADATGLLGSCSLQALLADHTRPDGSDFGAWLLLCFRTLGQHEDRRPAGLPAPLQALPRLNGQLFDTTRSLPAFSAAMRALVLRGFALPWRHVEAVALGLLLEELFEPAARRLLAPNTTSRLHVLKLMRPLFVDDFTAALREAGTHRPSLEALHQRLVTATFFDPHCGSGTLLAVAYRELRLLEHLVLVRLLVPHAGPAAPAHLAPYARVQASQLHGLDRDPLAVLLTEVMLWLLDHQLNQRLGDDFGTAYGPGPARRTARIAIGEGLTTDWAVVCPPTEHLFLFSNPPAGSVLHIGLLERLHLDDALGPDLPGAEVLDVAAGYYLKAAQLLRGTAGRAALVHSQALMQGRQGQVLWTELLERQGLHLHFAHRNFQWNVKNSSGPAVFCAVVGLGPQPRPVRLFDYPLPTSAPHETSGPVLNAYLVAAKPLVLPQRAAPLSPVPPLQAGSRAHDGGFLMLSAAEKQALLAQEPGAARFVRPYLGGEQYGTPALRWCLWLPTAAPAALAALPLLAARVAQVARLRAGRPGEGHAPAVPPHAFADNRQPATAYTVLPRFMAGRNAFVPVSFFEAGTVAGHQCQLMPDATGYFFGVLASTMYKTWARQVAERLRNDYLLTAGLMHHNFPFPPAPTPAQRTAVVAAAAAVRAVRAQHSAVPLAQLYDLMAVPVALLQAHQVLDAAVDACYRPAPFFSDLNRLTFLFELHQELATAPVLP